MNEVEMKKAFESSQWIRDVQDDTTTQKKISNTNYDKMMMMT
jgi:hypothetical protein